MSQAYVIIEKKNQKKNLTFLEISIFLAFLAFFLAKNRKKQLGP